MKKIILVLFVLILLSGCTSTSNVIVSEEGKVTEEVILSENKSNFPSDSYVKNMIDNYLQLYEEDMEGYNYEDISDKNYLKVRLSKKFDNICSYFNDSSFVKKALSNVSCKKVNNTYEIKADVNSLSCEGDCLEGPLVDNIDFFLKLPNSAILENADEVENNTYAWHISGNDLNNINLIINNPNIEKVHNKQESNKNIYIIIGVIIFIIILILLFIIYLVKKYKKNRFEY
jgi:flagellar basal body-associated protein FliL